MRRMVISGGAGAVALLALAAVVVSFSAILMLKSRYVLCVQYSTPLRELNLRFNVVDVYLGKE